MKQFITKSMLVCITLSLIFSLSGCIYIEDKKDTSKINNLMTSLIKGLGEEAEMYSEIPETLYKDVYNINPEDFDSVLIRASNLNVHAAEIILIKTKDEENSEMAEKALQARREILMEQWKNYLPEQYDYVKNSIIDTKGSYVIFVVGKKAKNVVTIFKEAAV